MTDLLLFHELRVGTVIDNVLAKYRCGKMRVDFLGIDILQFAV